MVFTPNVSYSDGNVLGAGSLNSNFLQVGSEMNGTLNVSIRLRHLATNTTMGSYTGGATTEQLISQVNIPNNQVSGGALVMSTTQVYNSQGQNRTHNFRIRAGSMGNFNDPVYGGSVFFSLPDTQALVAYALPMTHYVTGLDWTGSNFVSVTFITNNGSTTWDVKPFNITAFGA